MIKLTVKKLSDFSVQNTENTETDIKNAILNNPAISLKPAVILVRLRIVSIIFKLKRASAIFGTKIAV